ncbi:tRNA-dihydrouridine synthase, partial [bacterium]
DLGNAARCVGAMRRGFGGGIFTVKMRSGWCQSEENFLEASKVAEGEGADGIILHPRFKSQGYSGNADWGKIALLAASTQLPVAGSGDVRSAAEAVRRIAECGIAAVMIGRAALSRPWIFRDAARLMEGLPPLGEPSSREIADDLLLQYDDLAAERGKHVAVSDIKKFAAWAMRDFEHSSLARKAVMEIKDPEAMRRAIMSFGDGTLDFAYGGGDG